METCYTFRMPVVQDRISDQQQTVVQIPAATATPQNSSLNSIIYKLVIGAVAICVVLGVVLYLFLFKDNKKEHTNKVSPTPLPTQPASPSATLDNNIILLPAGIDMTTSLYYVDIFGVTQFQLYDEKQNELTTWITEGDNTYLAGYSETYIADIITLDPDRPISSRKILLQPEQTQYLTIEKATDFGGGRLEIIYGYNNHDEAALKVLYEDLPMDELIGAHIRFFPEGISWLEAPSGERIEPDYIVTGTMLSDNFPPEISVQTTPLSDNRVQVTITAQDESGVDYIRYSTDGSQYPFYEGPFEVNTSEIQSISLFANDFAGNRGARPQSTFSLIPSPALDELNIDQ